MRNAVVKETIFVVSTDDRLRAGLVEGLAGRGFEVHASRGETLQAPTAPQLAVVDVAADLHLLRDVRAQYPSARVVVMVPSPSARLVFAALRLGAVHCIARTANADAVMRAFTEASEPLELLPTVDEAFPTLDEARSGHIGLALDLARGNISRAARLLGIHRQSLQRILRHSRPQAQAGADNNAA
jgi:two-component system, response regulator RegA